jgi:hypothetical protein
MLRCSVNGPKQSAEKMEKRMMSCMGVSASERPILFKIQGLWGTPTSGLQSTA